MRLAVFTSKYPAKVSTFFERDLRSLLEAGIEVEVFSLLPLEPELWRYSLDILNEKQLPRERIHHLPLRESMKASWHSVRPWRGDSRRDSAAVLASAARHGPVPLAKTAYVLPKAWTWAAQHGHRFDHVLGYWGNYAGTCAWVFHRQLKRNIPFSLWLHAGTDLYRTPVFMREKIAYADNVITCCEFNRSYILDHFGASDPRLEDRLHVCHHGLDLAAFPFQPGERQHRHVIAVGRLSRHKGFDYLLRAAQLLHQQGVDLTLEIVGDGEERKSLESHAARCGIAHLVRFRGWLPFAQARDAMSRATILVHASPGLGDGLPNVIREAMALGTPVIATRVAGIPEALSDDCGVLVPARDVQALAAAMEELLGDGGMRQFIAERARRRVEERYDMWRNGEVLAHLFSTTRRRVSRLTPLHDSAAAVA